MYYSIWRKLKEGSRADSWKYFRNASLRKMLRVITRLFIPRFVRYRLTANITLLFRAALKRNFHLDEHIVSQRWSFRDRCSYITTWEQWLHDLSKREKYFNYSRERERERERARFIRKELHLVERNFRYSWFFFWVYIVIYIMIRWILHFNRHC